jgi:hypothetical protein
VRGLFVSSLRGAEAVSYTNARGALADSRFRRADWYIDEVYRDDLEEALARCSKRDRDLVLGWFDNMKKRQRYRESEAITRHQLRRDLSIIVKDQAAHIANLEAQLMPYLRDGEAVEQDAML